MAYQHVGVSRRWRVIYALNVLFAKIQGVFSLLFLQRKMTKRKSSSYLGAARAAMHDCNTSLNVKEI